MSKELDDQQSQSGDEPKGEAKGQVETPPAVKEDADVSHTRQFKGVLSELQQTRETVQQLRAGLAAAQQASSDQGDDDSDEDLDDDVEFMTKSDVRREYKRLREEEQRIQENERRAKQQQRMAASEARAREQYRNAGEGLDFDTVFELGRKSLQSGDLLAIQQADDPAQEAYRRCLAFSPDLQQRVAARDRAKLVEQINTGGAPKSRSRVTAILEDAAAEDDEFEQLVNLPKAELEKRLREAEATGG